MYRNWLLSIISILGACPSSCTQPTARITDGTFTYRLGQPDHQYTLDGALDEISGLTYLHDRTLAAVDDEEDAVFFFSLLQGQITDQLAFGKKDDYEGIECVNNVYYVLRSDGDIFKIVPPKGGGQAGLTLLDPPESVEKYETGLSKGNDTEGLGYDAAANALLIACKEGGKRKGEKDTKDVLVYRYGLDEQQLVPFLYRSDELFQGPLQGKKQFRASAIAQHPVTRHYYLLSSVEKSLIILDDQNQLLATAYLDRSQFPQPEGICFSPEGTLYISNEGRSGAATIVQFDGKGDGQ